MEYYKNEKGQIAVLYSPGFGAGWYTWNTGHKGLLFDPDVVRAILSKEEIQSTVIASMIEKKYGDDVYCGGLRDIRIKWMDPGTLFQIDEYDGSESIAYSEDAEWIAAGHEEI